MMNTTHVEDPARPQHLLCERSGHTRMVAGVGYHLADDQAPANCLGCLTLLNRTAQQAYERRRIQIAATAAIVIAILTIAAVLVLRGPS